MFNGIRVKQNGSIRRGISLGAFREAYEAAETFVATVKAAASSYLDLVRGGVITECGESCTSDCLHLTAMNRVVARLREAQQGVPGAVSRLADLGIEYALDVETRHALELRPADFVRVDDEWLRDATCSQVETAARVLGVSRPTRSGVRYHFIEFPEVDEMEDFDRWGYSGWRQDCWRCSEIRRAIEVAGHEGSTVHLVARRGGLQAA